MSAGRDLGPWIWKGLAGGHGGSRPGGAGVPESSPLRTALRRVPGGHSGPTCSRGTACAKREMCWKRWWAHMPWELARLYCPSCLLHPPAYGCCNLLSVPSLQRERNLSQQGWAVARGRAAGVSADAGAARQNRTQWLAQHVPHMQWMGRTLCHHTTRPMSPTWSLRVLPSVGQIR